MDDLLTIKRTKKSQLSGSCLCGGVKYLINGPVRDVVNCFCSQCRKTSGHHVASTRVDKKNLIIENKETLNWYECLPDIYRGFCNRCGGNLFWDNTKLNKEENQISIMAGTLDNPTGLKTIGNIHTEDASDYCGIPEIDKHA